MTTSYGYIRISSKEQHEDRQVKSMLEAGVPQKNLFIDKQSGKDFERPNFKRMMRKLRKGDVLVVKSIDRLGRDYRDLMQQWSVIVNKGVDIVVLDIPLLDTRMHRDLLGNLIANLTLQLLSYVAQVERDFIRQRQREGIDAARARGVRFGRPAMQKPASFPALKEQWKRGLISARGVARTLGISLDTALRWLKE